MQQKEILKALGIKRPRFDTIWVNKEIRFDHLEVNPWEQKAFWIMTVLANKEFSYIEPCSVLFPLVRMLFSGCPMVC